MPVSQDSEGGAGGVEFQFENTPGYMRLSRKSKIKTEMVLYILEYYSSIQLSDIQMHIFF